LEKQNGGKTMIGSYNALRELIDERLNDNSVGIKFDVSLYNTDKTNYKEKTNDDDGVSITTSRVVPTNIVEIVGNYINIPNTSVTENAISIEFDIFVNNYTDVPFLQQQEFKSVDYGNSLLAIDNLRKELLAKYYPLGQSGLMFGGVDSRLFVNLDNSFIPNTIYMDVDIKNKDIESLLYMQNTSLTFIRIDKTETDLTVEIDIGGVVRTFTVPYKIGLYELVLWFDVNNKWNFTVNGVNEVQTNASTITDFDGFDISSSVIVPFSPY
jgi:hypothetical protein